MMTPRLVVRTLVVPVVSCWLAAAALAADLKPIPIAEVKHEGPVNFQKEILPILQKKCLACHNATDAESDLVLETPAAILKGGSAGPSAIAGKGAESLLVKLGARLDEPVMPPEGNKVGAAPLTSEELGLIKLWIDQGATGTGASGPEPIKWQPLPPGVNPIYAVALSADGQWAAASRANQIFIYHVPTKREYGRLTDPALITSGIYKNPGVAHLDLVQTMKFSPDGEMLASGEYRTVKFWQRVRNGKKQEISGFESPIQSLAVSADGKWAAFGEENGKIRLCDLATGAVVRTFAGQHGGAVKSLAFAADGSKLVSGSADKKVGLWNVADGKLVVLQETPAAIQAITFVSQGQQVATGGDDKVVRIWAIPAAGAEKAQAVKELAGHEGAVTSLVVHPTNPAQLISSSQDGTVRVWDVAAGKQLQSLNHGGPVQQVAVRADGQRLVSVAANNIAKLWNAANGQAVAELKGDFRARIRIEDAQRTSAIAKRHVEGANGDLKAANERKAAEDKNVATADETLKKANEELAKKAEAAKKPLEEKALAEKTLESAKVAITKAESAKTAAEAAAPKADEAFAQAKAALEAATKMMATAEAAKKAADEAKAKAATELAAAQTALKTAEENAKKTAEAAQKLADEKTAAEKAAQSAMRSSERAKDAAKKAAEAIPSFESAVKLAEENQKKAQAEIETATKNAAATEKPLLGAAFARDGLSFATSGDDQTVHTWDAETGAAVESFAGQGAAVKLVAYTADNNVISVGANNSVVIWDTRPEWKLVRTVGSPDNGDIFVDRVTALDFSPDGKQLATGGGDPSRSGQLKIIQVADGAVVKEIKDAHSDVIYGLEFSPDGKQIASCGADRFAKIFDLESGKLVKGFEGHTHHVLGVTWRADGRMIATSGADMAIKVWDVRSGDQQRTIQGFGKEVTAIRFVAESDNVVTSCGDNTVQLKNASNGSNVRGFSGATDFVHCCSVSANGKLIMAGGQDSVVRLWQEDGKEYATFAPPSQAR